MKSIVLLSGGLDSTTTLYYALDQGYDVHGLIFDYGQRHNKEIELAKAIAQTVNCPFEVVTISMPWKGSALLDQDIDVPDYQSDNHNEIPITYVPARNIVFLSFAASFAEAVGADAIFIGANAVDYSGYPDCRPKFFQAYEEVLKQGLKTGVEGKTISVQTPLIDKTKAEIIQLGMQLNVPYELTWSCYKGGDQPCGVCDSCVLRANGFKAAGVEDSL